MNKDVKESLCHAFWGAVILLPFFIATVIALFAPAYCSGASPYAPYYSICELQAAGWTGSGTLIATTEDKALVLSCRHVCPSVGMPIQVNWLLGGKQSSAGTVIRVLPGEWFDTDLALVVCDRPRALEPIRVVRFDPRLGPWTGAGYRQDQLRIIHSDRSWKRNDGLIVTPDAAIGGMSGGPLFDKFGRVVAVVVGSDRSNLSVSADGDALHHMIAEFRRVYSM